MFPQRTDLLGRRKKGEISRGEKAEKGKGEKREIFSAIGILFS